MVNCLMAYKQNYWGDTWCKKGEEKRNCPGCCIDCGLKCSEEEEPNPCKTPVASAD